MVALVSGLTMLAADSPKYGLLRDIQLMASNALRENG